MIQAVFFDLYETLITEWENNEKKTSYSVTELGLDEEIYKREWATRRDQRMDGTFSDHKSVLKDILSAHNQKIDESLIEKIHQRRVMAKTIPFQPIKPEIITMLQKLKELNIKIGLISNCSPEEVQVWEESQLANFFDDVIFSNMAKLAKPSLAIYLKACQNLNVTPNHAIFVGDGGSNELPGATAAGMKAYHATWFQPDWVSEKIEHFPKLKHPKDLIEEVNKWKV